MELFHTVRDDSLCGLEKSGRLGHVPSGVLEGIDDQLSLIVLNSPFEGERRNGAGLFSGLKSGGEMMAVDHLIRAEEDRSLNAILEFSHIARPMVLHEHVNGWRGYPPDLLFMLSVEFFNKAVSQKEDVGLPFPEGRDEMGNTFSR